MKKICIIAASDGKNLELSQKIKETINAKGAHADIINLAHLELPLYTNGNDKKYVAADLIAPVKSSLEADGFFFVAPEYNGSTPPALNNFLAWVSRTTKNWRETFNSRPTAIGTHSAGGGIYVLNTMRLQLSFLGMNVLGRQIHTTMSKPLDDASITAVCDELLHSIR